MKSLLLFFFLVSLNSLSAQNWELFKDGETYNFNTLNIHGVRVDSVQSNPNDTIYYFNRIVNDTIHENYFTATYPIVDITQPNIFGDQAVKRNDSLIFKNQFNNILYLKPKAPLNSIWNFMKLDTLRIQAKIDSVYADTINGLLDSIKLISFQSFDSSNNPVSHTINAKSISYSNSNGFLKTFNFYEDAVGNSLNSNYKMNYTRIFQDTYFTRGEVYDLNVGDEYHFNFRSDQPNTPPGNDNYNHEVLSRTRSANNDTITLSILENRESSSSTVDYSTNPPTLVTTKSYSNRTFNRIVLNPNDALDSLIGFEPNIEIDSFNAKFASTIGYSFYLPYSQNTYNNRISVNPNYQAYYYDSSQNSWIIDYYALGGYSNHSLVGVISFTNNWNNQGGGGGFAEYYLLSYFKIGTETWGTPNIITGIEDSKTKEVGLSFEVYPNPAKDLVSISIDTESQQVSYRILNLSGVLMDSNQLVGDFSINTSKIPNGIYVLQLEMEGLIKTQKLIIQR